MTKSAPLLQAPVLYFDGPCGLCNQAIQYLARYERRSTPLDQRIKFATLQGRTAANRLPASYRTAPLTGVVLEYIPGEFAVGAEALRRIAPQLRAPWRQLTKRMPNWAYNRVAARRQSLSGHFRSSCDLPSTLGGRMLD